MPLVLWDCLSASPVLAVEPGDMNGDFGGHGGVTMIATQPGEQWTSPGTHAVAGGRIDLNFPEIEWKGENQSFTLSEGLSVKAYGDELILPASDTFGARLTLDPYQSYESTVFRLDG